MQIIYTCLSLSPPNSHGPSPINRNIIIFSQNTQFENAKQTKKVLMGVFQFVTHQHLLLSSSSSKHSSSAGSQRSQSWYIVLFCVGYLYCSNCGERISWLKMGNLAVFIFFLLRLLKKEIREQFLPHSNPITVFLFWLAIYYSLRGDPVAAAAAAQGPQTL